MEYVAEELRKLGLEVRLEKVTVPHWVRGEEHAELVRLSRPDSEHRAEDCRHSAGIDQRCHSARRALRPRWVVANNFNELAAMPRENVQGRVFNERFDHSMAATGFALEAYGQAVAYREDGRTAAARQGAVAALVRSAGGAEFRLPHTGETGYDSKLPSIPAGAITAEDAELLARLSAQGPVRLHLALTPKLLPEVDSYNVIADLKGSRHPEQVVVVSGHLDSWDLGTGALDDAAGIAVAMETAQILKQLDLQPERTIRVVAWMAEETGIFGGRAYAERACRGDGQSFRCH